MTAPAVEILRHGDSLIAIIVSHRFDEPGIHFFTPPDLSQQLAYMQHPAGHVIPPHIHSSVSRNVQFTQEVLVVRRGRMRVDFFDNHGTYIESRVLEGGDTILLASGGHGFEVLEDVEMIEVKQGPYNALSDKILIETAMSAEDRSSK